MFATNPEKAREWADETKDIKSLPEKKRPEVNPQKRKLQAMKKQATGLFFDKMARPQEGRFFRDLAGRDDGNFMDKQSMITPSTTVPGGVPSGAGINVSPRMGTGPGANKSQTDKPATEKLNIGATGGPVGGMGERGEGMSGGMYGTGTKTAGKTPTDWDADSGLPTGFHRATREQPEPVEAGGDRFHSTETTNPPFGGNKGVRHGLTETGGMTVAAGENHQIGKHASAAPPRFLGTSFGLSKTAAIDNYGRKAESYAGEISEMAGKSLREAGRKALDTGDRAVRAVAGSPAAMGIAALLAARFGLRGLKGVGRTAARLAKGRRAMPPPSAMKRLMGGARRLISG